jgi:hypothetical protein
MELISETGHPSITLTRPQCASLELKLNVSSKGKLWSHIGDLLFEVASAKKDTGTILLTDEQYAFLGILLKRNTWEDCQNL